MNGNDENQQQSNRFEKPFTVASSTRLVEKYLAQSPVIFLDLAHFVAQDMNGLIGEAAFGFSNCFFEHSYIMQILHDRSEDTKRGMGERVRYRTWLGEFRSVLESSTSQAKLSRSIRLLCDILSEVFSSPVG